MKALSEILPSSGLGLGPDEVGQKGLKLLHLWNHSQKIQNHNIFFSLQTWRIAESWGFNSFPAQSPVACQVMQLIRHPETVWNMPNHTGCKGDNY